MTSAEILRKTFNGGKLWGDFLSKFEKKEMNILYYPSTGKDFRSLFASKIEWMKKNDFEISEDYREPDLFIFSDYGCADYSPMRTFPKMYNGKNNIIRVNGEREKISPNRKHFKYYLNSAYVRYPHEDIIGKAFFFYADVKSEVSGVTFTVPVLYLFYENVCVIEQLFLRNKLKVTHFYWKTDGPGGYGTGNVSSGFFLPIASQMKIKWYYIYRGFFDGEEVTIKAGIEVNHDQILLEKFPVEVKKYDIDMNFELKLVKKGAIGCEDVISFYERVESDPGNQ